MKVKFDFDNAAMTTGNSHGFPEYVHTLDPDCEQRNEVEVKKKPSELLNNCAQQTPGMYTCT